MGERTCTIPGCSKPHQARGWCKTHYSQWFRNGKVGPRLTVYERFMAGVDTSGGTDACHPWTKARNSDGYGHFSVNGKLYGVHRWLLGYLRGRPLDPEEEACHRCDNPPCCNPQHLYVGDHKRNVRDAVDRGRIWQVKRSHCPQGHEYTDENTYVYKGRRTCITCQRRATREYLRKRRAKSSLKGGA